MRSRDGLAWNARWKVRSRGRHEAGDTRGNLICDRMGEGLPSVLRSKGKAKCELRNQRGNLEETGAARCPPMKGALDTWKRGWDTYSD